MSKIFISTNPLKARSCFKENEIIQRALIKNLINDNNFSTFIKIPECEIYLLSDNYNGTDDIGLILDFHNDMLLWHDVTRRNALDIINNFSIKKDSTHNSGNESLYRKVYLILLDDDANKYERIKKEIFTPILQENKEINITDYLDSILQGNLIDIKNLPDFLKPFRDELSISINWFVENNYNPNAEFDIKELQYKHFCLIRDAIINQ